MGFWPKIQLAYLIDDMQPGFAQRPDTARANTPQLRTNNVSREGNLDLSDLKSVFATEDELEKYGVRRGDVIFNNTNSPELVGKTAYFDRDEDFVISNHMTRIRANKELLDGEFLAKYLHYLWLTSATVRFAKRWVNQAAIDQDGLAKFDVILPPLPEQRRIVAILRQADDLRRERREIDEQAKQLLSALFHEMFGSLNEWKTTERLSTYVDFVGGGTPSRKVAEYFTGSIPWATSKDIKSRYLSDAQEHITEEAISSSATNQVPAGTILIVVKSKILMHSLPLGITTRPFCFGQDLKGLVPKPEVEPIFIAASMLAQSYSILAKARGVNTEGLTLDVLEKIPIPKATFAEQRRFADRVKLYDLVEEEQEASTQQIDDLVGSLFSRAFTGELTASWREAHLEELWQAAEERDRLLAEQGRAVVPSSVKPEVVEVAAGPDVTHPRYALLRELSPAQYAVYEAVRKETGYFTAETLATNRNLDAEMVRETLPVLEAVSLIARVNLISDENLETDPKQTTRQLRKIAYAPIYRAPRPEDDSRRDALESLELAYPELRQVHSDLEAGKSLSL